MAPELRERLSEAQNHRCAYCGADVRYGAAVDHVIPRSRGGSDGWHNLVVACRECNSVKGTRDAFWFFAMRSGQLRPAGPSVASLVLDAGAPVFQRSTRINEPGARDWLRRHFG